MDAQTNNQPFAVTGITGKIGGIIADTLLNQNLAVRTIVRSEEKGRP